MSHHEHKIVERASASDMLVLTERKIKPDGSVQEFRLEQLGRSSSVAVGRYRIQRSSSGSTRIPFQVPSGSTSDGYFWPRRPYVVYRFRAPSGRVLGHRVDAATEVRLLADVASYRDLALDWWVLPDGTVVEEDVEEFESLVEAGVLSAGDSARALMARRAVVGRWREVEAAIIRLEAQWAPNA